MYLKLNPEQIINLDQVSEVGVSYNDCYLRAGGHTYNIFSGENNQDALSILDAFIRINQLQVKDINEVIDEVFPPEVKSLIALPTPVKQESDVTITIDLDKPVNSESDITLNVDNKMTVKTALKLDKSKVQATAVYTAKTVGNCTITAKTTDGKILKGTSVNIQELVPEVKSITANPTTIQQNNSTDIVITLTKAIQNVNELTITPNSNFTVKTPPALQNNNTAVKVVYTATKSGTGVVTAKVTRGLGIAKTVEVTINPATASVSEIDFGKRALAD